jgi:adenylate kinase family enzyme
LKWLSAPIKEFNQAPTSTVEMVVDEDARFNEFPARNRQIKDRKAEVMQRRARESHLQNHHQLHLTTVIVVT